MQVNFRSIEPVSNYVKPALKFIISIKYIQTQEAITSIKGTLELKDKLTETVEAELSANQFNLQALRFIGERHAETEIEATMVFVIDNMTLDIIERNRKGNPKGDVEYSLSVKVTYARNLAQMSYVVQVPLKDTPFPVPAQNNIASTFGVQVNQVSLLFYAYQHDKYWQNTPNLVLLSSNSIQEGQPHFGYLDFLTSTNTMKGRITSSDWIQDYAPVLGLGEYFIVEIPTGEKVLKEAWSLLTKAEESYRRWDVAGVMSSCRLVGQNLDALMRQTFGNDSYTFKERWARIYGSGKGGFNHWVSLPLHTEGIKAQGTNGNNYDPSEVKADEIDCEAVLLVTKSLIKYAQSLIKSRK